MQTGEYGHGGDIYGDPVTLDFSVNVNPLGIAPELREVVRASDGAWERYPDIRQRALRMAAADWYRGRGCPLPEDFFLFGHGASDLLYDIARLFRGRRVLIPEPAFTEYRKAFRAAGAQVRTTRLWADEGTELSPDRLIGEILGTRPAALVIGNPVNPTGAVFTAGSMAMIAEACRSVSCMIIVDECFQWFVLPRERCAMAPQVAADPAGSGHIVLLNALTKIAAIPGLRLGYMISPDRELMGRLIAARQPWAVSAPAEAAGIALFTMPGLLERGVRENAAYREELTGALRRLGADPLPSEANYILFRGPEGLADGLLARGILIRSCADYPGLGPSWFRAAVRTPAENQRLIHAMEEIYGNSDYDPGHDV